MNHKALLILFISLLITLPMAAPMTGQIVQDPDHPNRMIYHNTYLPNGQPKPVFFAGPGDPEDLFYNNSQANVNDLISHGAKCTYITAYLADFGGGNPGSGSTMDATLNQWETWMTQMENAGIIMVFFFFDDSRSLPGDWQTAVDKIVTKFKHHKLLIWSVAEEYAEGLSPSQVSAVAARIKAQDDHDHVVGVHQNVSLNFDFNHDSNLDMFLMQYNPMTPDNSHSSVISSWNNVGGKKILNMAEMFDHADRDRATYRKINWACAMGGCSAVMGIWLGRASAPVSDEAGKYADCDLLTEFMESTDMNTMAPHDELAAGATKWVLAQPGVSYIAYCDGGSGDVGINSMTAGTYTLSWLDINSGTKKTTSVTVGSGTNTFSRPSGIGTGEVAVWITNGAGQDPPALDAVVVNPKVATILKNDSYTFSAQAKDQYGQDFTETITWSVSGGGTILNGAFTSNGTVGTCTITAAASSNSAIKDTARIIVLAEYPAPVASDVSTRTTINTPVLQPLSFQCQSNGPFEFAITKQPDNGTVNYAGNDATYTPQNGYIGTDTFKWTVTDLSNNKVSNEAAVTIEIIDELTITLVQYFGSRTAPTVQVDGFVNGATEANDRSGSQWTNVPSGLNGLTYLLTARDDKSDALGEDEVMYRVNASVPCTVYALVDYRTPAWITGDGWESTALTVTGDGEAYSVYKRFFPAGDIDLKRLKDGNSQGTGYVFKLAAVPSVDTFRRRMNSPDIDLFIHPNPFTPATTIGIKGLTGNGTEAPRLIVVDINGKKVAHLAPDFLRPDVVWHAGSMAAGVYIVTLSLQNKTLTKKIILVK
jgi:hypothetical protein